MMVMKLTMDKVKAAVGAEKSVHSRCWKTELYITPDEDTWAEDTWAEA